MENEEWRAVVGYEGLYEVSNMGRLKSLERHIIRKNGISLNIPEGIKKGTIVAGGYVQVVLTIDGIHKLHRLNRVVAMAFHPNPEGKRCTNHIDRNRQNNEASNLEWVTHMENTHHFMSEDKGGDVVGVSYETRNNRWVAGVLVGGKRIRSTKNKTKDEAIQELYRLRKLYNLINKYA